MFLSTAQGTIPPEKRSRRMVTPRRDLRTGKTYWEAKRRRTPKPTVTLEDFYDAVVVGAGISGALVAERLTRRKRRVLVCDKRIPAAGSTAASTALIQWEIDVPLTMLERKIGKQKARDVYKASFAAVKDLLRTVQHLKLSCDLRKRDTLLLAGNSMNPNALKREAATRKRTGLPSTFYAGKNGAELFGLDTGGLIVSKGNCELDPVALADALLVLAQKRGAHLAFPAEVASVDATSSGVFIRFADDRVIACRKLLFCTGYEAIPSVPKSKYDLVSTWALATNRIGQVPWKDKALIWQAADPYLYMRTTDDGRIIAGGEDASFTDPKRRDALIPAKTRAILRKLHHLFPHLQLRADYAWAGTFAESPSGLPIIGPVAAYPNVFAVLGSGGNGITFSAIASKIAAEWVAGRDHPLQKLFAPGA
jgi:glycine/D-amino acid oxidase-like deaminating enzyme